MSAHDGWVNWNPEPKVHAYGATISGGRVIALCRVQVREQRGEFDCLADDACLTCAAIILNGLGWDDVKDLRSFVGPRALSWRP